MEILNNANFKNSTENGFHVVYFSANWCRPCLAFGPIFEEFGKELAATAKFWKVDIDQSQEIAADYGVVSIPTIIIFQNGQEIERTVGAKSKIDFKIWINKILK